MIRLNFFIIFRTMKFCLVWLRAKIRPILIFILYLKPWNSGVIKEVLIIVCQLVRLSQMDWTRAWRTSPQSSFFSSDTTKACPNTSISPGNCHNFFSSLGRLKSSWPFKPFSWQIEEYLTSCHSPKNLWLIAKALFNHSYSLFILLTWDIISWEPEIDLD